MAWEPGDTRDTIEGYAARPLGALLVAFGVALVVAVVRSWR